MSPAVAVPEDGPSRFALAILPTSVKANELWVAPAKNSADRLIAV
jgi:hypothetical protein